MMNCFTNEQMYAFLKQYRKIRSSRLPDTFIGCSIPDKLYDAFRNLEIKKDTSAPSAVRILLKCIDEGIHSDYYSNDRLVSDIWRYFNVENSRANIDYEKTAKIVLTVFKELMSFVPEISPCEAQIKDFRQFCSISTESVELFLVKTIRKLRLDEI